MTYLSDTQLVNINENCGNGFQLNVREFIVNNKVEFIKHRDIDENTRIVYKLYYATKYRKINNHKYDERLFPTNRFVVMLKIGKWVKSDSLYVWMDTNDYKIITRDNLVVDKKSLKFLMKLTHELDDDELDYLENNIK